MNRLNWLLNHDGAVNIAAHAEKKNGCPKRKKCGTKFRSFQTKSCPFLQKNFSFTSNKKQEKNLKYLGLFWESNPAFAVSGPMSCPLDHQRIEIQASKLRFYYQLQQIGMKMMWLRHLLL